MLLETSLPLCPAEVLLRLREHASISIDDLLRQVAGPIAEGEDRAHHKRVLIQVLKRLEDADLARIDHDEVRPDSVKILQMQTALGISLRELARARHGAVIANPRFKTSADPAEVKDVFVATSFDEQGDAIRDRIFAAAEQLMLTAYRADDVFDSSDGIIDKVWSLIRSSKIVIADCTGLNANVFYEIGMSHTVGTPTVLLTQKVEDVPFDLRHIDCVLYSPGNDGETEAKIRLAMQTALKSP